jgi:hypothetical protein
MVTLEEAATMLPSTASGLSYLVLFDSGEMSSQDAVGPFSSIKQIDDLTNWPEPFDFQLDERNWRRTGVYLSKPIAGSEYHSTGEILEERVPGTD